MRGDDDGRPFGLLAEFESPERLVEAVRRAREAGYSRLDAYSPFPVEGLAELLGYRRGFVLPLIALAAAVVGGAIGYGTQYYLNAVDYPLNVGGRPLHSWPAFLPAAIVVCILWATVASVIVMLALNRLPELYHPVFNVPAFERASDDRFFLCIRADDPAFVDGERTLRFLEGLRPCGEVAVVPR